MPKPEVKVIVGESTRRQAHNLDDTEERSQIRRENLLGQAKRLNGFERLVKTGELELHELPQNAIDAQVGQEVYIERGQKAYWGWARIRPRGGSGQPSVYVDLDSPRLPAGGSYTVVFRGPASQIKYRDPKSNERLIGGSDLIHFVVLKRRNNQIALRDPCI